MAHELESIWILIHPPLAILGYAFTFLALKKAVELVSKGERDQEVRVKDLRISLTIAFGLTFLGLVTGMIWAWMAWGSPWSWDPKETATLFIFVALTGTYLINILKKPVLWQMIGLIITSICILITVAISFLDIGLHSFG